MLPALSRLRLGDATGVTLNLVARPNGKVEDDAVTGTDKRTPTQVRDEQVLATERAQAALNDSLEKIIADLKTNQARRDAWRLKVVETMESKIAKYEERMQRVQVVIDEERAKIDDYMKAAFAEPSGGQLPLTTGLTDPWDVAKDVIDRWRTLRSARSTLEIVKRAAQAKKDEFFRANTAALIAPMARELAEALEQMKNDYSTQPELLETMRQLFVSFLANASAASEYRANYILMGNPGTGKTRMARSIAKVLGTMGIFVYDNPQEVYRSDFVADYEGQTAGKTRRLLEGNLEKVIFLDEAYMLTTWDKQKKPPMPTSYSAESTGELLTFLENNVGSTCFIAAGYEDKMQDEFLRANPGLTRRFTQFIYIPDYKPDELERIFLDDLARKMSGERAAYQRADVRKWFTTGALQYLKTILRVREDTHEEPTTMVDEEGVAHEVKAMEYNYPHLQEMFNSQAGAMVTLAAETKLLLGASGRSAAQMGVNEGTRSFAIGPEDVKKIIESRFLKKSKDPEAAVEELRQVACSSGWLSGDAWKLVDPEQLSKRVCADDYEDAVEAGAQRASKRRAVRPDRLEPKSLAGPSTVNY
jgi:SpoVK/Ycf46/Vps4 family AAA+-type ATPase